MEVQAGLRTRLHKPSSHFLFLPRKTRRSTRTTKFHLGNVQTSLLPVKSADLIPIFRSDDRHHRVESDIVPFITNTADGHERARHRGDLEDRLELIAVVIEVQGLLPKILRL